MAVATVIPNLCDDVDTMDDLQRIGFVPARGRRRRSAGWPPREGRAPLGRRRRRAVRVRPRQRGRSGDVTVIGNVGDDLDVLGLAVSPDLDSILYALAGLHDEERGWGRAGETWEALGTVSTLGGEDWFRLGDRDLGLHLVRTQALRAGEPLSAVTARLARALGVEAAILPATDDGCAPGSTRRPAASPSRSGSSPAATATRSTAFASTARRAPAPGVLEALDGADAIVIAPSNPYVSIWPILAVEEIRAALVARRVPCVAVSPLVGGRAVKGPADRMLARIAGGTAPEHVAACYAGLIDALVVDESDPAGPLAVRRDRHADADDRPRCVAPAGRDRARGRGVRVAVVGGTGSFGQAVAKRLVDAGVEIVIGSRDAERAREAAEALGCRGCEQRRRRPRRRPRPLRGQGGGGRGHRARPAPVDRLDAGALGVRRARLRAGRREADARGDVASPSGSRTSSTRRSPPGCTRSPPRISPRRRRRRTRSSAETTRRRRSSRSTSPEGSSRAAPSTAGRWRARAHSKA